MVGLDGSKAAGLVFVVGGLFGLQGCYGRAGWDTEGTNALLRGVFHFTSKLQGQSKQQQSLVSTCLQQLQ